MARYKNGVNGSFKGKVGSVTGCKWKGIDYMRSLPKVTESRPLSDAELANRKKFAAAHFWLQPITPLEMSHIEIYCIINVHVFFL